MRVLFIITDFYRSGTVSLPYYPLPTRMFLLIFVTVELSLQPMGPLSNLSRGKMEIIS